MRTESYPPFCCCIVTCRPAFQLLYWVSCCQYKTRRVGMSGVSFIERGINYFISTPLTLHKVAACEEN